MGEVASAGGFQESLCKLHSGHKDGLGTGLRLRAHGGWQGRVHRGGRGLELLSIEAEELQEQVQEAAGLPGLVVHEGDYEEVEGVGGQAP